MTRLPERAPAQPFFLDAAPGTRFCLYHPPAFHAECRGAFIYVHPFAEEMNKTRRVAACQARTLAAQGYAVLQMDLHGCGDSSGDFGEARWATWKTDLATAHAWLHHETAAPTSLWGVRLGALLALDFAHDFQGDIQSLLLWQPVLRGDAYLTQFLRVQMAAEMLAGQAPGESGTHKLREKLYAGESVEVAGYWIAPELAKEIEAVDAAALVPRQTTYWFELTQEPLRPLSPAVSRLASSWGQHGANPVITKVQCPPFWMTQESADCPDLIRATSAHFDRHPA